jgi:hypothetical protein
MTGVLRQRKRKVRQLSNDCDDMPLQRKEERRGEAYSAEYPSSQNLTTMWNALLTGPIV